MMQYFTGGNVKDNERARKKALADLERAHNAAIREQIKKIRTAAKGKGEERNAQVATLRSEMERMKREYQEQIAAVRRRFDEQIETLKNEAEILRTDLRGSAIAKRNNRARDKERTKSTTSERKAESDEQVENDIRANDAGLLPYWYKVRRTVKADDRMSRYERFLQMVHDDPEGAERARLETSVLSDITHQCDEGRTLARQGVPGAAEFVAENCEGKPKRPRPQGTPVQRTPSLFKTGERPDAPPKSGMRRVARPKRGAKAAPGQADFSAGKHNTRAFIDTDAAQVTF